MMIRGKGYFDKLLNEENLRSIFDDGVLNQGLTQGTSRNEVELAISRKKKENTTGIDGIPVEVWKCVSDMLWDLMQWIYEPEKIPMKWRCRMIVPMYKEKGDIHDYGHYRGRKLTSHYYVIIIIIMAGLAVFLRGWLIEERRRWPVITASPRGQCSK